MIIPTGYSYKYSHPIYLRTIAKIFGIKAMDIKKAKILEIGSKIGMNILPMAFAYPEAKFIGIEYSEDNLNLAKSAAKELSLTNVEFKKTEEINLKEYKGKFDYIISHEIFSEIESKDQEFLLKFVASSLKDTGVSYLYFDVWPGCFDKKLLNDMLRYHTSMLKKDEDKILQCRNLFNFFENSLANSSHPYQVYLENLQENTNTLSDKEFFASFLERELKNPCYFFEFINKISKVDLHYLAESFLPAASLSNLPKNIAKELATLEDKNQIQQYIDFITSRKSRSAILCKKTVDTNLGINSSAFKDFYFTSALVAETKFEDIDIKDQKQTITFYNFYEPSIKFNIKSPRMKAIMYSLIANPSKQFSLEELVMEAAKKLKTKKPELIKEKFLANVENMVFCGYVNAVSDKFSTQIIDLKTLQKPKILPIAKYQVEILEQNLVTTNTHDMIQLDHIEQNIIKLMDGINDKAKIISEVIDKINNGEFKLRAEEEFSDSNINKEKVALQNLDYIVAEHLDYTINKFYTLGLLI